MLLMGKSTISMAIFNSYVKLPEGNKQRWIVSPQYDQYVPCIVMYSTMIIFQP